MAAGAAGGTYVLTLRHGSDADYRAVFATPSNEGINGDTSPTVTFSCPACGGGRSWRAPDAPCI